MDAQSETARAKSLFVAAIVFVASGIYAYSELMYLIRGKTTTATITEAYKVGKGVTDRGQEVRIDYEFTDADGNKRTGSDRPGEGWQVPPDRKVEVRYRPGADGSSRIAGRIGWITLGIFAICLGVVGFFGYRLWREAKDAYAKPNRKR